MGKREKGEEEMKVGFFGELRAVVKGNEFKRRNGETGFNVNVTVESDEGRSYYFQGTEDVYKAFELGVIQKGDYCAFEADYNPQWKFGQFIIKSVQKNEK